MEEMHSWGSYNLKLACSVPNDSNTGKTWSWNAGILNGIAPCPRSLHSCVEIDGFIYIFGGNDGVKRLNDFYKYDCIKNNWQQIVTNDMPPSPRDSHISVVHNRSIFIFGGHDGVNKINDFYEFNVDNNTWQEVLCSGLGAPPSPRHSHCAVVCEDCMYIFGGFDGINYLNDFFKFNFITNTWNQLKTDSQAKPTPRYKTAASVFKDMIFIYGGSNGSILLNDFYCFNVSTEMWTLIDYALGIAPCPRDSHKMVTGSGSLFVFGGSGKEKHDFFQYKIDENKWSHVEHKHGNPPTARFNHSAVSVKNKLYIFGGFDGKYRLNDIHYFQIEQDLLQPSTLLKDLANFVNSPTFSDITFLLEDDKKIYAHKMMMCRCPYFKAMLCSEMKQKYESQIKIENLEYETFLQVVTYLYTDDCVIDLSNAMKLFEAADIYGIERLKKMCEHSIMLHVCVQNAAAILQAADLHNAATLRDEALHYILVNFDAVSKTKGFERIARSNVDLVLEIIKKRG